MDLNDFNEQVKNNQNGWQDLPNFIYALQSSIKEANDNSLPIIISDVKVELTTQLHFDEMGRSKMRLPHHGKVADPDFHEDHLSKLTFNFKYHSGLENDKDTK